MTAPFLPAGAAEFPNDNPSLHDGARWVCPDTVGRARALLRPRASGGAIPVVAAETSAPPPRRPAEEPPERRLQGPLQLDLGRILLLHRVEDVPPPPEFVYRPFVSSRRREAAAAPALAVATPIDPRPCRVVDERDACRRVERGWRVDVAPCVNVGASGDGQRARPRRRGGTLVRSLSSPPAPAPLELEAASA
ncbi:MAG TPA: hypothetical protein VNN80_32625 [Polyangiaceae bacterium]|nr:hypothetical protein [Polyangiaceae bacterium]